MAVDSIPRIMLVAQVEIPQGSEVFYDYNDRRINVVRVCPWMTNDNCIEPTRTFVPGIYDVYIMLLLRCEWL